MSGTYDPRITAYFGDAVLQAGFMPLPHLFLRHYRSLGLSQVQAMFVLQLMEIAWDLGDPPNTISKIATRMGLSQRSVRACSKEVHDLGLIEIYDQWDDAGAQVENAYDLGPLFRRLADLVPAQVPSGQQRMRRQREHARSSHVGSRPDVRTDQRNETTSRVPKQTNVRPQVQSMPPKETTSLPMQLSASAPVQKFASPPRKDFAGDPEKDRAVPPGQNDQAPDESTITGPLQKGSALKEENKKRSKKSLKKQQEHHGGGVQMQMADVEAEPSGFSLRWNVAIRAEDVVRSRTILDRAGLHALVVERTAPTLTPAECWSLVCYARGASLGPAWIASQVYDWTRRQPQPAPLNRRYDEVGRLLDALPIEQIHQLIDITDRCCPQAAEQWESSLSRLRSDLSRDEAAAFERAMDAVWTVMAEQRHSSTTHSPAHAPSKPTMPPPSTYAAEWSAVLEALQQDVPYGDWRSWIAPLELLELDRDTAIIGAPNVFVRNEVSTTYTSAIADALRTTFGRDLNVEVVIGTMVLG